MSGVEALFTPGGVHELRIPKAGRFRTISGYFDTPDQLAAAAIKNNSHGGVYFTINPCNPALLARNYNTAAPYAEHTTSDADIASRRWLFIDLDPDRPAGIPSTDAEHQAALGRAEQIAGHLTENGWPEPIVMDSGNGAYLLYRIDEPNDRAALDRINGCLKALAARFDGTPVDGHTIKVDTTGGNASRIVRIPTTTNRKGSGSPDRQHRPAVILSAPTAPDVVDTSLLDTLAGEAAGEAETPRNDTGPFTESFTGAFGAFDLEAFIGRHFPDAVGPKMQNGTQFWELPVCPFAPDHNRREAFIGRLASGALTAGCHHNSCTWGWSDLRNLKEPRQAPPNGLSAPPNTWDAAGTDSQVEDGEPQATTWEPFDLGPWLDGTHVSPQPEVGIRRTDGQALLYPGREHVVFGETECGKSWFALECVAREIRMGRDVVYIHYEEGDPGSTIERLRLLSVPAAAIATHLRFVAPARAVRGEWLTPLLDPPPTLVIHDGVNEAMSLHGDDVNATDGAATFRRTIIKPFLTAGVTSLACDHVVKNSDTRGRYAIGSVHKVNAIDGAAFLMENIEPFGRGLRGASAVYVAKDRPGQLRAHGRPTDIPGKTLIGVLSADATGNSEDFLVFWPPKEDPDPDQSDNPKAVFSTNDIAEMVYTVVCEAPDATVTSRKGLFGAMRAAGNLFRDEAMRDAAELLVATRRLIEVPGKRGATGYRAVTTSSRGKSSEPDPGGAAATSSREAAPLGADYHRDEVTAVDSPPRPTCADEVGRGGTRSNPQATNDNGENPESACRYCGDVLPAHMKSRVDRGYCHKPACLDAARAVTA